MKRVYNFSPGPAMLPTAVLETAQAQMLDWDGSGMSVMEISHRSEAFADLLAQTKQLLRDLLNIPSNYQILFMPGGAKTQFAMIPMNLLADNTQANYCVTGTWSELALREAERYGDVTRVLPAQANPDIASIPAQSEWNINPDAKYFYYTPNETLQGLAFPNIPDVSMPLVADMTSCLLSQEIDISRFGLIYASAQKNLGQAGVTVVIVRDDLISAPQTCTPSMFSYENFRDSDSLYNTSPTYAIYIMNLVLQHWQAQGGMPEIVKNNVAKKTLLYDCIDNSDFYTNKITPAFRSSMNVTFNLPTPELEALFVDEAAKQDLLNLTGHKKVGGIRASIYNAMPLAGVQALVNFMQHFAVEHT